MNEEKNTREWPIEVALSLSTGKLLCDFQEMHRCAEWILGHPIWTHEFAIPGMFEKLQKTVLQDSPELNVINTDDVTEENFDKWVTELHDKYGETVTLTQQPENRENGPISTYVQAKNEAERRRG